MSSNFLRRKLAAEDTARLVRQALSLGIDIPRHEHWWCDDSDELIASGVKIKDLEFAVSHYLTDEGIAGIKNLIRIEKRKNVEWWVKIALSVVTAITGLIGAWIGLVSVMKR